jgi:hypothetical protein
MANQPGAVSADELRLTADSGFRENALRVLARRRLAARAEFA